MLTRRLRPVCAPQSHASLATELEEEYKARSNRDRMDYERRVNKLQAQVNTDKSAVLAEKKAAVKVAAAAIHRLRGHTLTTEHALTLQNAHQAALESQRAHNSRVEALLARIEQHEAAESEAMRSRAVAEAALLEVQAKLSHTAAARKVR